MVPAFLAGGGEMGERIRAYDWGRHPLGPPDGWPQALQTVLHLMLNTHQPMYLWWGCERFCFKNTAFLKTVGQESEPPSLGRPEREAWRDLWEVVGPEIEQVMTGGEPVWRVDAPIPVLRRERREEAYWTYSFSPVRDESAPHGIGGVIAILTETTEAIAARDALRESEARLRLANDAANIGTWDYDPVTTKATWEPRAKEMFGFAPDEAITYESFLKRVHPDDRESVVAAVAAALDPEVEGRHYDMEYRITHVPDGNERWMKAIARPFFENGRAVRLVGVVFDITLRRRLARRLEVVGRAAAAIAAKFDVAEIAQVITDAGAEVTGAELAVFSLAEPPAVGSPWIAGSGLSRKEPARFPRIPPSDLTAMAPPGPLGPGALRSDDILSDPRFQRYIPAVDGAHPPMRSYLAVPIVAQSGVVHGWMLFGCREPGAFTAEHESTVSGLAVHAATAIDNTRLVEALRAFNATLEERVANEVSERLEAEQLLRQAQKLEAIGQLTGGIAHDFNNLLTVISAGLHMLERSKDENHAAVLKARMAEAAKRGATLTEQLLAFGRKREAKPEVVRLSEHLNGISGLLSRGLGGHLRVETDAPDDVAAIYVDPTGLQLAILNLTVNARDATPQGGVITVRARNGAPGDPDAPYVSIAVVDEGVGMDAETQARMFDLFFTTKEVGKGSGLGLPQVRGFARQSGGSVEVESAPGKGTTVTMVLPRSVATASAAEPPAAAGLEIHPSNAGWALLVEDDDDVAAMTSSMLEQLGWTVVRVASAEAALVAISGGGIDLVFTDVMMPGRKSGLDLAMEIRSKKPGLPIVLTSGASAVAQRAADAAELPLIPKPFSLQALAAALSLACQKAADATVATVRSKQSPPFAPKTDYG
jgi:PAS domain S-box-containing protein